jgi:hypothetical protein
LTISLNIFKEKAKIRARIAHLTDPKEREDNLLQLAVEDRMEAEQKVIDAVADANRKIGHLESEKVSQNFSLISSIRSLKG